MRLRDHISGIGGLVATVLIGRYIAEPSVCTKYIQPTIHTILARMVKDLLKQCGCF